MKSILSPYKMLKGTVPSFSPSLFPSLSLFSPALSPFSFLSFYCLVASTRWRMKGNGEASPLQGEFPVVLGLNLKEAKLPPDSVTTPDSRRTSAREMVV